VVFGGPKDTGLKEQERQELDSCPTITLIDWSDVGHNTLGQTTALADLILRAVNEA